MKEFTDLQWLIGKLTSIEKKILLKFINISNEKASDTQSLVLIRKMMQGNDCNESNVQKLIYGKINTSAFRKLIKRLYEKVLDVILLKQSFDNNPHFDKRINEIFLLRKKLLQFDLLISRGYSDSIWSQLDKIIKQAYKYEYFDILLLALYKKRRVQATILKQNDFKKLTLEIFKVERNRSFLNHAEESFHLNCTGKVKHISKIDERRASIQDSMKLMQNNISTSKVSGIQYYLFLHQMEYYDLCSDYYSSLQTSRNLVNFLERTNSVSSTTRLLTAKINLANINMKCYYFSEAFSTLHNLDRRVFRNETDDILVKEILLQYYIFSCNSLKANDCLVYLEPMTNMKAKYVSFYPKYLYYSTTVNYLFDNKKTNGNLPFYELSSNLPEDKWKFSQRVFQIQLLIESEKFEQADFQIENNRKFVERLKKSEVLNARQALISKILVELSRKSYDFKKVWKSRRKELDLLDSVDPDYRWQIMSPELVVFHEWFQAQLNHEKYDHGKVMARMKAKISPVVQKPLLTLPADGGSKHNRRVSARVKGEKLASA